jgi:phosphate transport system substrate-binding protein
MLAIQTKTQGKETSMKLAQTFKRTTVIVGLIGILALGMLVVPGCSQPTSTDSGSGSASTAAPTGAINVVSREDGSGTRSAFVELFEVQVEKDGKKVDATTTAAVVTNSTSVMLTTVEGDKNAIGYLSLGSMSSTVKALKIDGVDATVANVKSGNYKIARPFNIVTSGIVSAEAQDFIDYIMSKEGQQVIQDSHYIAINDSAIAYGAPKTTSGKIVVAGSSSVTPVMEKLKEAYKVLNPGIEIQIQQSDSSTGITSAKDGVCDIGMSSRELKDSELAAGLAPTKIAIDGLAVIVNNNNTLGGLTKEQVGAIFLGTTTKWDGL